MISALLLPPASPPFRPPPSPPQRPQLASQPVIVAIAPRFNITPAPEAMHVAPQATPVQSAKPASPPALPSPPPDYLSQLAAHLNAYKIYPTEARIRREQGTVRLHFVLDRAGHVLSFDVARSSGSTALDQEARAMIQHADPFPPPPPQFKGETLDLVVPLVFSLH
jgi:periplasmic protein TonB